MQGIVMVDSIGKIRRRRVQLGASHANDQFRHSLISQIRKEVAMISLFILPSELKEFESVLSNIESSLAPKLEPEKLIDGTRYQA